MALEVTDVRTALIWKWIGVGIALLPVVVSSGGRAALATGYYLTITLAWLFVTAAYSLFITKYCLQKKYVIGYGTAVSFILDTVVTVLWMVKGIAEMEDFWLMPAAQVLSVYSLTSRTRHLVLASVWCLVVYGIGTVIAWRELLGSPHMGTFWIHVVFSAIYVFGYYRFNTMVQLHEKLLIMKRELESSAKELASTNELLARLSYTDSLTTAYNNRYFYERLEELLKEAKDKNTSLAVIMVDIDHFKRYNDTHGHREGDRLLREITGIMVEKCRETDIVCRYGGEEFGIILPRTTRAEAYGVAERIREAVEEHPFKGQESQPNGILTISAGIAVMPDDASTVGELVERADAALYNAKHSGRNVVKLYTAASPIRNTDPFSESSQEDRKNG